ncbi:MAG: 50S ribosomal protein L4 [Chloroflexota bacterium]
MAELPIRNLAGEQVDTVTVSDDVFGAPLNIPLMHQAVVRIHAGQRMGTHKAKTRAEVRGGGVKPWRQKGTGRARQGTKSSPVWRGGGVAFPPTPRKYEVRMPKKMRRQATRSALSARLQEECIIVVDSLIPEEPRTKVMIAALEDLNVVGKVLLIDQSISDETDRAARNIPGVELKQASILNIVDVLNHDKLVFSVAGIRDVERLLSHGNA